jgi:SAM-dependent methyltransferase
MANELERVRAEFDRAAAAFTARTRGRFDDLDVVSFARVHSGATVLEVGAGSGNFLSLFDGVAHRLIGVDVSAGMLDQARRNHPNLLLIRGNATQLPLGSRSIDLATSAQMLHHIPEPVPVLKEMRRVIAPNGHVLIVDQVAIESSEAAIAMTELELLRDPTHAVSRPPSALKIAITAAGLGIVDTRVVESRQRLSEWMWPDEFPPERLEAVRTFIADRGSETGMEFEPVGEDYVFTRRRLMALARRV